MISLLVTPENAKAPSPPPRPPPKPVVKGPEFHTAVLKSKAFKERSKRELQEEKERKREETRKRERPAATPREEQSSSSSKRSRQRSPTPPPPKSTGNRNRIESDYDDEEEEYDSEMDDFIDDGDQMDVSAEIRKIMGYDRRKFVDEDDDCDDMEAGFSEVGHLVIIRYHRFYKPYRLW